PFTGWILPIPLKDRRERIVVAVLLWRKLLLELGLRAHFGPHRTLRLGVLVGLGGLAFRRDGSSAGASHSTGLRAKCEEENTGRLHHRSARVHMASLRRPKCVHQSDHRQRVLSAIF